MTATLTNVPKNRQTAPTGGLYYGFGAFTFAVAGQLALANAAKTSVSISNQSKN